VTRVNGREIHSLQAFREAIRHPRGPDDEIELLPGAGRGKLIYDPTQLAAINDRVRKRYGIPPRTPGS